MGMININIQFSACHIQILSQKLQYLVGTDMTVYSDKKLPQDTF